jgi:hypothetical protein
MAGACDGEKETGDGDVLVVQKTSLSSAALESHKLAEASLKDSARSSIVDIDGSVLRVRLIAALGDSVDWLTLVAKHSFKSVF